MSEISHGANKEVELDDPYALVAEPIPGGRIEVMAECLIEEFALLGWEAAEIEQMFFNPFYQAAHLYYASHGKEAVRQLVGRVLGRCGVVRASVVEAPEEPEDEELNHA